MHKLATVLTFIIALQYISTEHVCEQAPPGRYCTDDLSGFHDCIYNKNTNGYEDIIITCPVNTRCGCFLRNKCQTSTEQTCERYADPNFVKDFMFQYSGTIATTGPTGSTTRSIQGLVVQNSELGRFKREEWDGPIQKFEYVIKNARGKFDKYVGTIPGECSKSELSKFPLFGDQIQKSTRTHEIVTENNTTQEEWFFQVGRLHNGDTQTSSTWTTERFDDENGNQLSKPVSFNEIFQGSNLGKTDVTTKWTVGLFFSYKFQEGFFQTPFSCFSLVNV